MASSKSTRRLALAQELNRIRLGKGIYLRRHVEIS